MPRRKKTECVDSSLLCAACKSKGSKVTISTADPEGPGTKITAETR